MKVTGIRTRPYFFQLDRLMGDSNFPSGNKNMSGMIAAAGGVMAKLKAIHAAAYPKAKTGKAAGASKGSASRSRLRFGGR